MIDDAIIQIILSIPDVEKGGDNALDGFEFQVSSAIYLIFEEMKNKNDFALIYEKLEDFIIFTGNIIHLYQAKSISKNLSPKVLYTPSKVSKNNNSTLSIIEKMYDNYSSIKQKAPSHEVYNNLLICENNIFSDKLSTGIPQLKELRKVNFSLLDTSVKLEISQNTKNANYDWSSINAIRLIPKTRHEEVTRVFIEDVIQDIIGENKINSSALYNSLTNEIRKIRKQKTTLTNTFIMSQINKFATIEDDLKFNDYIHLLNEDDKNNILQMQFNFNAMQNFIRIQNHPNTEDYKKIRNHYKTYIQTFGNSEAIYQSIKSSNYFKDICIRLDEYEIKALILIVIAKELN